MTCALYRHFDADGALLYIGISQRPVVRLAEHARASGWRGEIVRVELEHFETREAAEAAEQAAIAAERPAFNVVHASPRKSNTRERATRADLVAFIESVGGVEHVAERLNVKPRAVVYCFEARHLTAAWYLALRDLADEFGVAPARDEWFSMKPLLPAASLGGSLGIANPSVSDAPNVPSRDGTLKVQKTNLSDGVVA